MSSSPIRPLSRPLPQPSNQRFTYQAAPDQSAENVRELWRQWIIACLAGEMVGFGLAVALGGALAVQLGDGMAVGGVLGVAILAGLVEGSVVGWAQWRVLRRRFHRVRQGEWVLATAAGAAVAWTVGMSLGTFALPESQPPPFIVLGLAALLGAVTGSILGVAQWVVLRSVVAGAGRWIAANALGWSVGLAVSFAGMSVLTERTPLIIVLAIATLIGAMMALAPATVTGWTLIRLAANGKGGIDHERRRTHPLP